MFEERSYRKQMGVDELVSFNVTELESDLQILAKSNLEKEARKAIRKYRRELYSYIKEQPNFLTALSPLPPLESAPSIIKNMCHAASLGNVGPMAAVAGAISRYVGLYLLRYTDEIIIENGGDIFLKSKKDRQIMIYAGTSPFSNKLALLVPGRNEEFGICTSSGTVGHSLSFGKADAVVILSRDTLLADAVATATGNLVKTELDIESALSFAMSVPGILGAVVIIGDKMGALGEVNFVKP
jgi:ApbE superfamily uncharacterized protein (UPF0280 family)